MKLPITMKHALEGINFANFLQSFWKEQKFSKIVISETVRLCAFKSLIYFNLYKSKSKWVLSRRFLLT